MTLSVSPTDLSRAAHTAQDLLDLLLSNAHKGTDEILASAFALQADPTILMIGATLATQAMEEEIKTYSQRMTRHVEGLEGASRAFTETDEKSASDFGRFHPNSLLYHRAM